MADLSGKSLDLLQVSVVIPCFRCAGTIERAVSSAVNQSHPPLEVILVDDASDDSTPAILDGLSERYAGRGLRVIRLPANAGPSVARNVGWNVARGDLVAFLDADDLWHGEKLARQVVFMQAHPEIALCAHEAGILAADALPPADAKMHGSKKIAARDLLFSNRFITPSVVVRRALPLRFRHGRRHMEDHLLWMEIALAGYEIAKLDAVLAWTFKPAFGASGLSAAMWKMEQSELDNYRLLWRAGYLPLIAMLSLCAYSLLKFARRLLILSCRKMRARLP